MFAHLQILGDGMPKIYTEPFWHLGSYRYPYYRYKLRTLFESYVKKSHLVLDAGCGDGGGYLVTMSQNTCGVGFDIDRKSIEKSMKKARDIQLHNLSFLVADLDKMPFRKNQFNLIICCDVLEHLDNSEKAIRALSSSLKRGGRLLISTSNEFNPMMFIDLKLPKKVMGLILRKSGVVHHKRTSRFNPWSLVEMLRKGELIIEKLLTFGYPPFPRPWIYQFSKIKPPRVYYLWILFNRLTNVSFLRKFKENILVVARK